MTDQSTGERTVLKDYDLPGNDLDPNTTTPEQRKKISLIAKVYGLLCLIDGIVTLPVAVIFIGMVVWALQSRPDLISVGQDPTLTTILMVMSFVVTVVTAGVLIFFGISILRNHRRNAARWSHVLLALNLIQFLFSIMLQGIGEHLIARDRACLV